MIIIIIIIIIVIIIILIIMIIIIIIEKKDIKNVNKKSSDGRETWCLEVVRVIQAEKAIVLVTNKPPRSKVAALIERANAKDGEWNVF